MKTSSTAQIVILVVLAAVIVAGTIVIIKQLSSFSVISLNEADRANLNKMDNANAEIKELKSEILKEGSGPEAKDGDKLSMHYTGTLLNGTKFDSSVDRGTPFEFILGKGEVIKGWDQGIKGMKSGEKRKLTIPANLGYGPSGIGSIPPNSALIFEVELLKIN
ncbi:MAG TPA: FKBP-type peptidyl-prolyl cis-trans isomerase [Patescibacteria group bacterium]|nr:FKBP-type peptidyl-prolyl cis-trans isomerase [Patescibacteria group bacterium]